MEDSARIKGNAEAQLVEIWKTVLDKPTIDVDSEFLDLGGDSLSAMMCMSRVRREFGVDLSIEDFFMDGATITRFACLLSSGN